MNPMFQTFDVSAMNDSHVDTLGYVGKKGGLRWEEEVAEKDEGTIAGAFGK